MALERDNSAGGIRGDVSTVGEDPSTVVAVEMSTPEDDDDDDHSLARDRVSDSGGALRKKIKSGIVANARVAHSRTDVFIAVDLLVPGTRPRRSPGRA